MASSRVRGDVGYRPEDDVADAVFIERLDGFEEELGLVKGDIRR